jgi:hypothetical protein
MPTAKNPYSVIVRILLTVAVIGCMIWIPGFMYDAFPPEATVPALVVSLASLLVGTIFYFVGQSSKKMVQRMYDGETLISKWTCSPDQWIASIERIYKKRLFNLKLVVGIVTPIVLTIFLFAILEFKTELALLSGVGVGAFIFFIGFSVIKPLYNRDISSEGNVFIGTEGALVGNSCYLWKSFGVRLIDADIKRNEQTGELLLLLSIESQSKYGPVVNVQEVPVPAAYQREAESAVQTLKTNVIKN